MFSHDFAIADICPMMGVSRVGCYKWKNANLQSVISPVRLWLKSFGRNTRNIRIIATAGRQFICVITLILSSATTLFINVSNTSEYSLRHGTRCITNLIKKDDSPEFQVITKRWIIERTFAWFESYRRLSKDFEYHADTSLSMIQFAMIKFMLNKIKI